MKMLFVGLCLIGSIAAFQVYPNDSKDVVAKAQNPEGYHDEWMKIKAELKQEIMAELKSDLVKQQLFADVGEICPSSCVTMMEELEDEIISNKMAINFMDTSVDQLSLDLENYVYQLNANDSNINSSLHQQIEEVDQKIQDEIDVISTNIEDIQEMPTGSIISWVMKPSADAVNEQSLPEGWIRCDGSIIPEPSIWAGSHTPNLNGESLFLRGGNDKEALVIEDDMLQDHTHIDDGHTHSDGGHTHDYVDNYTSRDCGGAQGPDGEDSKSDRYKCGHNSHTKTTTGLDIHSSVSGIGCVDSPARIGSETRPKNMRVIWIMRVW